VIDSVKSILGQQLKLRNSIIQMIVSLISDKDSDQRKRLEFSCGAGHRFLACLKIVLSEQHYGNDGFFFVSEIHWATELKKPVESTG
jgi:type I restriction-modification system DNA methylase subunit